MEKGRDGLMDSNTRQDSMYYDSLRVGYEKMLVEEVLELKDEKPEVFDMILKEFTTKVAKLRGPDKINLHPDWPKILQVRDQYGNGMKNVERVADRLSWELETDIRKATKPWWCMYGKFGKTGMKKNVR